MADFVLSVVDPAQTQAKRLSLNAVLKTLGFDLPAKRTKLVRHQDKRYNVSRLIASRQLEVYQANQGKAIFGECDHLLAFSADGGSRSEFLGLYHVRGMAIDANRG